MSWVFYSMILKNGANLALESGIYSRIMGVKILPLTILRAPYNPTANALR